MEKIDEKIELLQEAYRNTINQEMAISSDDMDRLDRLLSERGQIFENINRIDIEIEEKMLYDKEVMIRDLLTDIAKKNDNIMEIAKKKRIQINTQLRNISSGKKIMNNGYDVNLGNEGYYIDKKN